jgi:hypothetical protein
LTRPAWDALLVKYFTAGMALRFIQARKPQHWDKVEIPAGASEIMNTIKTCLEMDYIPVQ